jgi:CPA2 family monovalent cation:H+ antiporter-2
VSTALVSVTIQLLCLASGVVAGPMEGLLVGLSVSLSSLSVVLDYVHAHGLEQSTHAKVMVGVLGFQGLLMGLFFSLPPALSGEKGRSLAHTMAQSLLSVGVLAGAAVIASRHVLPRILALVHKGQGSRSTGSGGELYLLAVVSIAMGTAILTEFLGLSLDLGAFVAGLMLSGTKDTARTAHVMQPLASVFGSMLFGSLGMIINLEFFWKNLDEVLALALELVVVKALVIGLVVRLFDFPFRTSLLCGVGLSHVGEFSLIFSSKLHAHNLITRRAYLLFLAASVSTLALAPLVLRAVSLSRWGSVDAGDRSSLALADARLEVLEHAAAQPAAAARKNPSPVVVTEWRRWRG